MDNATVTMQLKDYEVLKYQSNRYFDIYNKIKGCLDINHLYDKCVRTETKIFKQNIEMLLMELFEEEIAPNNIIEWVE